MRATIETSAKNYGGREVYRSTLPDRDYDNVTYEFATRRGANEFIRAINGHPDSKYAPSFCDLFKYARVTVFVRKGRNQ